MIIWAFSLVLIYKGKHAIFVFLYLSCITWYDVISFHPFLVMFWREHRTEHSQSVFQHHDIKRREWRITGFSVVAWFLFQEQALSLATGAHYVFEEDRSAIFIVTFFFSLSLKGCLELAYNPTPKWNWIWIPNIPLVMEWAHGTRETGVSLFILCPISCVLMAKAWFSNVKCTVFNSYISHI